jgi:hypothetical protein
MDEIISEYLKLKAHETDEINIERRKIFYLIYRKTNNVDEAITYANINVNIKYLKCKYPS